MVQMFARAVVLLLTMSLFVSCSFFVSQSPKKSPKKEQRSFLDSPEDSKKSSATQARSWRRPQRRRVSLLQNGKVGPFTINLFPHYLHFSYKGLTPALSNQLGLPASLRGVFVSKVKKKILAQMGLEYGDVITRMNNVTIRNSGSFKAAYEDLLKTTKTVKLTVRYAKKDAKGFLKQGQKHLHLQKNIIPLSGTVVFQRLFFHRGTRLIDTYIKTIEDFNQDGHEDFYLFFHKLKRLVILSGRDGSILFQIRRLPIRFRGFLAGTITLDINNNGKKEVLVDYRDRWGGSVMLLFNSSGRMIWGFRLKKGRFAGYKKPNIICLGSGGYFAFHERTRQVTWRGDHPWKTFTGARKMKFYSSQFLHGHHYHYRSKRHTSLYQRGIGCKASISFRKYIKSSTSRPFSELVYVGSTPIFSQLPRSIQRAYEENCFFAARAVARTTKQQLKLHVLVGPKFLRRGRSLIAIATLRGSMTYFRRKPILSNTGSRDINHQYCYRIMYFRQVHRTKSYYDLLCRNGGKRTLDKVFTRYQTRRRWYPTFSAGARALCRCP